MDINVATLCVALVIDGILSIALIAYSAFLLNLGYPLATVCGVVLFLYITAFRSNFFTVVTGILNTSVKK